MLYLKVNYSRAEKALNTPVAMLLYLLSQTAGHIQKADPT